MTRKSSDRWAETDWQASMYESSLDSQPYYRMNYRPRPAVRITWWRRVLRKILDLMT